MDADKKFLKQAIRQAKNSLAKGGFPAGAVLVKDGKVMARSGSLGPVTNDPTAHCEMMCIRKACKKLDTMDLEGCVLYGSIESCLMCFSAANWAHLSKIVYGCKKTDELVDGGCYEGKNDHKSVNDNNKHKVVTEYLNDFESEIIAMIDKWVSVQKF